jgi:hypothetical protein
MKDVYVFIAEPGNTKAVLAVSALSRAMKEMNKVAILRCVWRQGQANLVVGVLTPNVSDRENIVGFLSQFINLLSLVSYKAPTQTCTLDTTLTHGICNNMRK